MKMLLFVLIFFNLTVCQLYAQSVEDLVKKAFEHSPMLKSKSYAVNAAGEFYKKESIFKENPVFSFAYSNVPISEWPALDKHPMSGISLGISQYIAAPWEDYYRKQRFYQKYMSEKEAFEEAKNLLAFQVQSAYHQVFFLYKKKQILIKNRDVLKNILKLAESLVSVNKMSSAQLLKLRADISILDNNIIEVEGLLSREQAYMEKLCGTEIDWQENDAAVNSWINLDASRIAPEGFVYTNHPLYKKFSALYQAGVANRKLEKARLAPGVTIGLEYRIRQEIPKKDAGEDFISIKASTPIPLFYPIKDRHMINASVEEEKGLKEMMKDIEIDLNSRWQGEISNHEKLMNAFSNFEKIVLPGYWAAYQAHFGSLAAGTVNLLDVLDAYRMYLNASLEDARLYRELMISKLRLDYLIYSYPGKNDRQEGKKNENR